LLPENEKAVIVYFNSPDQANKALEQMKSEFNVIEAKVDRFDGYPGDGVNLDNPIAGEIPSLGALTLGGDFNRNAGILAATNVSASGYSSGGPENRVTGVDIILTAIVPEEHGQRAMDIAYECGALR
jgi:hypothetical protein